ncbi:MAG: STAS domain-containing protein [Chloroflexi bacterium]|nr:STAS domain-containing protein [Chloroflexota bacterium]MBU1750935.1 STAS domain-containing protein [Chloroflexota bacterium]MBU1878158.1 STAS domain-containing protein [Chloroflexota bacterium]
MGEITVHTRWTEEGIAVLSLTGRLDAQSAPVVQQTLCALMERDGHHVLVNMAEVNFIDSTGLTALMAGFQLAAAQGRSVRVCCVQPNVRVVLQLTMLDRLLSVHDDEAGALANFPQST